MTLTIIFFSAVVALVYSLMMIKIGANMAVVCLVSPFLSVTTVFVTLRAKYTLFELGPFIIMSLFLGFVLSLVIASALCWFHMRKSF